MTKVIIWNRVDLSYLMNGRPLPQVLVKAAADMACGEIRGRIRVLSDRLQGGAITLDEWYAAMQENTKFLHAAEIALARGGWGEMRERDWQRASEKALEQWEGVPGKFPGLRAFAEDISKGRYGSDVSRPSFNIRAQMYADAGHGTYENERTMIHQESGYNYATRVAGAVDHCPTCLAEDDKKRPIEDVVEIGASECGSRCRCAIIYSRD
jgi:hypothetical protein